MSKAIGLLTCTILVAATCWFAKASEPNTSADQRNSQSRWASPQNNEAQPPQSAVRNSHGSGAGMFALPWPKFGKKKSAESDRHKIAAKQLLLEARKRAARGETAKALELAKQALRFRVVWSSREDTPDKLIRELQQSHGTSPVTGRRNPNPISMNKSGTQQVGRESTDPTATPRSIPNVRPQPFDSESRLFKSPASRGVVPAGGNANPVPATPLTNRPSIRDQQRQQVNQIMQAARDDMNRGDFSSAKQKAEQAERIDVTYGLFDERPIRLLDELARSERLNPRQPGSEANPFDGIVGAPIQRPAATLLAPSSRERFVTLKTPKQQATQLLQQANADLLAGRYEAARAKAIQADGLNVTYHLIDETRPRHILDEIEKKSGELPIIRSRPRPGSIAQ